jgi:hypothetical protein
VGLRLVPHCQAIVSADFGCVVPRDLYSAASGSNRRLHRFEQASAQKRKPRLAGRYGRKGRDASVPENPGQGCN